MNVIVRIQALFAEHGASRYEGARQESVSALEHALQCAQLAEWALVETPLVAAAFLHDVGHFVAAGPDSDDEDDVHELRAVPFLAEGFGADVIEPVRLHVAAKRYLVTADPGYAATLSSASLHSLQLQGGAMSPAEARAFAAQPYALDAIQLRRWDDLAKEPGRATPELAYYLALLEDVQQRSSNRARVAIGSLSVS
jgi:phosphonate degradation associated HDIG domain protein